MLRSSSSSIMDDAGPPSLFVVLSYRSPKAAYCISVLQLEIPVNYHESAPEQIKRLQMNQQDYGHIVVRFREPPRCPLVRWLFSPPTASTEDLYMVPDWGVDPKPYFCIKPPLRGYKFNFRTGECRPIKPPKASKSHGHVVNGRGEHIYFMAHPDLYYDTPDPVFECYDPDQNRWKALEPFPDHAVHLGCCSIDATAVLDDTILFNMGGCRIWAYNVPKDKWYIVLVDDNRCYGIVGEAVVLDNTDIYALTDPHHSGADLVFRLSIQREENDGDTVFRCSLRSVILVPGMDQIKYNKSNAFMETRHLVHLGKDNFCLVRSCNFRNYFCVNRYQPIQLTSLKRMGENSMTVTNICVYEVEIQPDNQFEVRLCFSLPECKTTALKQGKRFVYNLDPCRQGHAAYASKQGDKTDFNLEPVAGKPVQASTHGDGAAPEKRNNAEEGHYIYVRNLPPDATVRQLEKELKKFGSIKRDGIRVIIDDTEGNCNIAACVVFESATSKRDAIEASSITIHGYRAVIEEKGASIEEKGRIGLTVDDNRTRNSTEKKFKEEVKDISLGCIYAPPPSEQKEKTDFNPEPEVGKPVQETAEEGHFIYVRNLPQTATVRQLEKKLEKFGSIKRDGIRLIIDEPGSCPSVVRVEFESATSKHDAVKASTVIINGRRAVIEEKIEDLASLYIPCYRQGDAADTSKQKDKTDFNLKPEVGKPVQASTHGHGAASERGNTAEGHCIYVTNLPPDATLKQVEKKLEKFGSIKRGGILGLWAGNCLFGVYVKFESATSKRDAIEASSIKIAGCRAEIEDYSGIIFLFNDIN